MNTVGSHEQAAATPLWLLAELTYLGNKIRILFVVPGVYVDRGCGECRSGVREVAASRGIAEDFDAGACCASGAAGAGAADCVSDECEFVAVCAE